MAPKPLEIILIYVVYAFAFEELVLGQPNQEMIDHGRIQYQLLKEKSSLPRYGPCWTSAVKHLDEGCRHLSEDTQSDIALHITNCFLETAGHETYNCELDKKANVRAICINSMSDRAFNVYTEFYTHTQNMCWFLRGQIWQEMIVDNTVKVGKQLEASALHQQDLLKAQKESLELQEKIVQHGKFLEKTLETLYIASEAHKDVLTVLSQSINNLQSWIIGEVSWIDSILFYITAIILISLLTSSTTTSTARLPIFLLLFINLVVERAICSVMFSDTLKRNIHILYSDIYTFIWYLRYALIFLSVLIVLYKSFTYQNLESENNNLLHKLKKDNEKILDSLSNLKYNLSPCKPDLSFSSSNEKKSLQIEQITSSITNSLNNTNNSFVRTKDLISNSRYNLRSSRSRQNTPEC